MSYRLSTPFAVIDFPGAGLPDGGVMFDGFDEVISATTLDAVVPALARVEAAVAAGAWAAGYLAYDAAPAFDASLQVAPRADGDVPLLWFGLSARPPRPLGDLPAVHVGPATANDASAEASAPRAATLGQPVPAVAEAAYLEAFARIQECLAAGETYQVNLTFPMDGRCAGDLGRLFLDLRRAQAPAYAAWLHDPGWDVLSISPELFFETHGRDIRTRPMKGTRRRGLHAAADAAQAAALVASPKERAENVMIVDLLRNDLGRVAELGSVHVPTLFALERYPTVWQLTSTVAATLRAGVGLVELCRALFPCGSVTGAPKVHTMGLIAREERQARGVYCGAIGLLQPPGAGVAADPAAAGRSTFSVAIRTLTIRPDGAWRYPVGSGLVIDADGPAEYRECLAKAHVLHAAAWPEFELLESLLATPTDGLVLLGRHLDRLADSAAWFGVPCDRARAEAILVAAVRQITEPHKVRLLLDRAGAVRVEVQPLGPRPGSRLRLAPVGSVHSADPFLYHKTTHRAVYDRARLARGDADDVILRNERGELTETTHANLALLLDGRWLTPALDCGLLAGTWRAAALERGDLHEAVLHADDLDRATGLMLMNSVRGQWLAERLP